MQKYLLIALQFILISIISFSQNKITIKDGFTEEAMPFVKVIPSTGSPQFTDIDGKVTIAENTVSFQLRFHGYRDTLIEVSKITDGVVYMRISEQVIQEVLAVAGENPAHRIMDKVIENRKKNHPLENDAFTYTSYSKFVFDVDSSLRKKVTTGDVPDSMQEMSKFLTSQHIFLLESASERTFIPPARDRENVIAYKASGISNPIFATFAQSMQSFNFYDNQFDLLGNSFVNPIAFGGTKRYLFILQDTTVRGSDTTFTISYRPRKGKDFKGLQGQLFINTNGYAIEKVIAEPYENTDTSGFELKIIQDYELIDNKKWFPVNLSSEIKAKGLAISFDDVAGYLVGVGHTYIKDVKLNPEDIKKRGFGNIALSTEVGAERQDEGTWESLRNDSLTDMEKRTYTVNDSIGKEANFDKKLSALLALSTGKLRLGYVSLLLDKIVNYNLYEGFRLGVGLETSDLLFKKFTVGGYFGYGTKDYKWKYGAFSKFYLNPRRGIELSFRYQQDLVFRGGNEYVKNQGLDLTTDGYANYFRSQFESQRLAEMQFSYAPLGNITTNLFVNYQRIGLNSEYAFTPSGGSLLANSFELFESSLEANWNIRERVVLLGNMKVAKPTNLPKLTAKVTKGMSVDGRANLDYGRASFKISEDFKTPRNVGEFKVLLHLSQTFGNVPLYLNQTWIGTRVDWSVSSANTFETVYPAEFYNQRQASFFVRYETPSVHTKAKWNEPQFIIHHGIGYGDFKNKQEHNVAFKSMDKGLFEGGLILSGLLKMNFLDAGIGLFYRYGYYSEPQVAKNLVPKISVKFAL